jgi:hypothetical protein
VLTDIYGVDSASVGYYLLPFAVGNFLGPLLLGRCFDATTQTVAWCVIFFFASAGASAAYLTVSEIFPMETRAMAIAFCLWLGRELSLIQNLLEDEGELSRSEIGNTLGCEQCARCASATRSRKASSAACSARPAADATRRDRSRVEAVIGRSVSAFLSDNHADPDVAVENLLLEPRP